MSQNQIEMSVLQERLRELERSNGRLKRGGLVGLLLIGCMFLTGALKSTEVVVNKLILKDEQGKIRAGLEVSNAGPGLVLLGDNGEEYVVLSAESAGGSLSLKARGATIDKPVGRISLLSGKDGPMLSMRDKDGKMALQLDAFNSTPDFQLMDPNDPSTTRIFMQIKHNDIEFNITDKNKLLWKIPK